MKTLLAAMMALGFTVGNAQSLPQIGIATNLENDSLTYAAGYTCLVESIAKIMSPRSVTDEQFADNKKRMSHLRVPIYAVNIFMPGDLKLVGPTVDESAIIAYAEQVFQRCEKAGITLIVWGSGGARRVPDGFAQEKAREQFAAVARKVAVVAARYKIVLALENLNSTETNFITTAREALEMVTAVNHPNFRLCVDIYHMLMENEKPDVIELTEPYLIHVDIAENKTRTPPGVNGDDFGPYLLALKKVNYTGKIILECRWENLKQQAKPAHDNLLAQLKSAYR